MRARSLSISLTFSQPADDGSEHRDRNYLTISMLESLICVSAAAAAAAVGARALWSRESAEAAKPSRVYGVFAMPSFLSLSLKNTVSLKRQCSNFLSHSPLYLTALRAIRYPKRVRYEGEQRWIKQASLWRKSCWKKHKNDRHISKLNFSYLRISWNKSTSQLNMAKFSRLFWKSWQCFVSVHFALLNLVQFS